MRAILIGLVVAILVTTIGASAETTTDITWDGGGIVDVEWKADNDAEMTFYTGGNDIEGRIIMEDKNDNPCSYGIDTCDVKVSAKVKYGGEIEYWFNRTDSHKSMYGEAGQGVYTYVLSDDEATFDWHSWSNYAQLRCCNYGWKNNNQITAKGNHFIYHRFYVNEKNGVSVEIGADGKTNLTIMNEDHWKDSFKFGKGCGCYPNCNVSIDGSGYFRQIATAEHHLETDTGIKIDGEVLYKVYVKFTDGFLFTKPALEGN